MNYIIDRIENDIIVCENQETKKIENYKKEQFEEEIQEGDIVILKNNKFKKDKKATLERKKKIEEMMKKLMKG